jgi:hypothetical protein
MCQMGSLFNSQTIVVSVICKHLFEFNFVCLYTYEFWLCKIVRSSVILLLPLYNLTNNVAIKNVIILNMIYNIYHFSFGSCIVCLWFSSSYYPFGIFNISLDKSSKQKNFISEIWLLNLNSINANDIKWIFVDQMCFVLCVYLIDDTINLSIYQKGSKKTKIRDRQYNCQKKNDNRPHTYE